ncbi:unknown protein [Seminavis robusta]|uniref:DDE-1 domain-containing protein n=1 Tax=Seminavis robusta TaxID=568900 RepID=A0A9N8DVA4_9STRA|nr:unknown protein [Seminavis robusta]|eukprot:Sro271_g104720.1 n/a (1107) ;mRNA; f:77300-80620
MERLCRCTNRADQQSSLTQWKKLGLENDLAAKVCTSNPALLGKIKSNFPVASSSSGNENEDPNLANKTRKRDNNKNVTRSKEQWRELLVDIYYFLSSARSGQRKESVHSYCQKVLKSENSYQRIVDVWRELDFESDLAQNVAPNDPRIIAKLDGRFSVDTNKEQQSARDLRPSSNSYFDQGEEAALQEAVAEFARAGFPLEKTNLMGYANAFLEAEGIDTSNNGGPSMDTVERVYKAGRLKAMSNVGGIDRKRAAQAGPETLNALYHQMEYWMAIAHEVNPIAWPEARYADVPPSRIYNTDEQGPNPTALRNPVLIPRELVERHARLFQNTREGDGKMSFHYSVANIVRADGAQCLPKECVEGAPAPYILISDGSSSSELDSMDKASRDRLLVNQSEDDTIQLNPGVYDGWFDDYQVGKRDTLVNPFGFQIRTTPTGSMLKRTFFDFILHFKNQLPHDQGPNGHGVVLFLDWHCSRECPQSLLTAFFEYNILIFVLPSKTSIWSQPCDNGKNETSAKDISQTAHDLGLMVGSALDYRDANRIFRQGLQKNCIDQNDELRRTGRNAVVSSFEKTGLYPMSYDNEGWQTAIRGFGKMNSLIKQQKRDAGLQLPNVIWAARAIPPEKRSELSEQEKETIRAFLPLDDFLIANNGDNESTDDPAQLSLRELPLVCLAMAIAEHLIGKYTLDEQRDMSQPPSPHEPFEHAALKLVEFVALTEDNHVDTTCMLTKEAIARDKLRTKLALVKLGFATVLRRKADGGILNLTKQKADTFLVLDCEQRLSQNWVTMTVGDILDQCYDAKDDESYKLTVKDKKKCRKKQRIARKKLNASMYEEAKEIARSRRLKRNLEDKAQQLSTKRPRFYAKLAAIMEEEAVELEDLYGDFEDVVREPYTDTVVVTRGDTTKDIDVSFGGGDISAISHYMQTALVKVMVELKAKAGEKERRKRRRYPGTSTHLGKSGIVAGILIQRQIKEDELKATEKEEKSLLDELDKLKSLVAGAKKLVNDMPDTHWHFDKVKGDNRKTVAKMFGVFKSSNKADEAMAALQSLELSKESFEAKLLELESSIKEKETKVAPIVAKQREQSDFLLETEEYYSTSAQPSDETNAA